MELLPTRDLEVGYAPAEEENLLQRKVSESIYIKNATFDRDGGWELSKINMIYDSVLDIWKHQNRFQLCAELV